MFVPVSAKRLLVACGLVLSSLAAISVDTAAAQRPETDQPVKFKKFVVQDDTLKQPAFDVLIPSDWKGEGKVIWRPHPIYPATGVFAATKPGSPEQIVIYPHLPFVDGMRQAAAETAAIAGPDAVKFAVAQYPEGGNYMGNEVRITMNPAKYVEEVLIKRLRKDIKNYRVIKVENMPEWAKASVVLADAVPGMPVRTSAARVRIEYTENGRTLHEDFFVLMANVEILKCNYWGAESASSVRAEAGQLDKLHGIHQTVVLSQHIDEKWFSRYVQTAQFLQDMVRQQQKHVMDIHRIITETNNHVSKTISDSYWARQKSLDHCNLQFSNYIRGVDQYVLPGGKSYVTLPSGYSHVWVNDRGEYTLSNNALFNPNQSFGGTWTEVKPKR